MARHVCVACGKDIIGQSICVKGEHFHKECFACGKCKSPITGQFKTVDGMRVCMNCTPATYCAVCKKAVSGKMMKMGNDVMHPECFKCAACSGPLQDGCCWKDEKLMCTKCATSTGKVKVTNTCSRCGTEQDADTADGTVAAGKWTCRACFTCGKCATPLKDGQVKTDAALEKAGEWALLCAACGKEPEKAEEEKPCLACKKMPTDPIRLLDKNVICSNCLHCKGCGSTPSSDLPALLTNKARALQRGVFMCSKCDQATESELGTYGGRGKVGRDDVTYCICLRPRHIFWLDYTAIDPVRTTSFHAEGKYERTANPDDGAKLKLTVEMSPFGGGPKMGTVYNAELFPGAEIIIEGISCSKTAEADAELHSTGDGGANIPEFVDDDWGTLSQASSPAKSPVKEASSPAKSPVKEQKIEAPSPAKSPVKEALAAAKAAEAAQAQSPKATTAAPAVETPSKAAAPVPAPRKSLIVPKGTTLSLAMLKDAEACKAQGVDPTAKETYLSDEEFEKLFEMSKEAFAKMPKWKKDQRKKAQGLF